MFNLKDKKSFESKVLNCNDLQIEKKVWACDEVAYEVISFNISIENFSENYKLVFIANEKESFFFSRWQISHIFLKDMVNDSPNIEIKNKILTSKLKSHLMKKISDYIKSETIEQRKIQSQKEEIKTYILLK